MKRPFQAGVAGLVILAAGCVPASNAARDQDNLLRTDREWAAAAAEGKDLERIVSFWSDDATVIPAGAPVAKGKAAIRAFVAQSLALPGFHIAWTTEKATLSADGTLGYLTGTNATTFLGPDGKPVTETGRSVTVWRRSAGGDWKCVIDTWNSGP